MLHKILTAGPSAFNITTILSQAAQLSNQGKVNAEPLLFSSFFHTSCDIKFYWSPPNVCVSQQLNNQTSHQCR